MANPAAVTRAGHTGRGLGAGNALFDAVLTTPTGVVFTEDHWDDVWHYVKRGDRRFTIAIEELLDQVAHLEHTRSDWTSAEFPLILSAGERRSFTANTIIRDPDWRRRDRTGALRISAAAADRYRLTDGTHARLSTHTGSATVTVEVSDMMRPGHIALPNGFGLHFPGNSGENLVGVAPNELTSAELKDGFAGTPWHKHVPARLEPIQ